MGVQFLSEFDGRAKCRGLVWQKVAVLYFIPITQVLMAGAWYLVGIGLVCNGCLLARESTLLELIPTV